MNNVTNTKERLHWVDAAKGFLILFVVITHMEQRSWELGVSSPFVDCIRFVEPVWLVFLMGTFFIISGFWGNYDLPFKDFIVKNAKSLLLPLIVFSFIGGILHELLYEILKHTYNEGALVGPSLVIEIGYWFILAMFVAKCVLWLVYRWIKNDAVRWVFIVLIYIIGVLLMKVNYLPNYVYWKWGVALMIYLPVGQVLKKHIHSWGLFFVSLVLFVGVWFAFYHFNIDMPQMSYGMPNLDLVRAVPSFLLCVTGSIVVLKLFSLVKRARVLEFVGRNTLAIYVMHWWVELLAIKVMRSLFSQGVWMSTLATLICIVLAVLVPCLISELLNRPKLKWIIGR